MSEAYVGEVRLFAGAYAPEGWIKCDGSTLTITEYQALYALIGVTYGGDGVNNFKVPDFRGRTPLGAGSGATNLSATTVGQIGGSETVTLTNAQIPAHTHAFNVVSTAATDITPSANPVTTTNKTLADVSPNFLYLDPTGITTLTTSTFAQAAIVTSSNAGAEHDNIQPSTGITYIMCTIGTFPPFN
jgi:microcystin-dependent protein